MGNDIGAIPLSRDIGARQSAVLVEIPPYDPDVLNYGYDNAYVGVSTADRYVNQAVVSSGDGKSLGAAFKTIQEAVTDLATVGGTIAILAGTYREEVSLSGAYTAPLRLVRYQAEVPIVSGAEILSGAIPCVIGDLAVVGSNWANMYKATILNAVKPAFSPLALNLHEADVFMPLAIDQLPNPEFDLFISDPQYWHTASAMTEDGSGYIDSLTDISVLPSYTAAQLINSSVKLYGSPNVTGTGEITAYDGVSKIDITSTMDLYSGLPYEKNYALLNIIPNMTAGQWGFVVEGNGDITVYFWPTDSGNVTAGIEYSKRDVGVNLGTGDNVIIQGLKVQQQAGAGLNVGICIGNHSSAIVLPRRSAGITIENNYVGKTQTEADGYGAIYVASSDNVTIKSNTIEQAGESYGMFISRCSTVSVTLNYIHYSERSSIRVFGAGGTSGNINEDIRVTFNKSESCGREIHSNKLNFYEGCNKVLVFGNKFNDCYGYATFQEASNVIFAFCDIEADNRLATSASGSAIVDQNHSSDGPPDNTGILVYYNCHSIPNPLNLTDGDGWNLAGDQDLQTTNFYNNIFNGGGIKTSVASARVGDQKNNIRTVASVNTYYTDPSDIDGTVLNDIYEDAIAGDFRFSNPTTQSDPAYDMSTLIASTYGPMFPGFNFDQDINGLNTAGYSFIGAVRSGSVADPIIADQAVSIADDLLEDAHVLTLVNTGGGVDTIGAITGTASTQFNVNVVSEEIVVTAKLDNPAAGTVIIADVLGLSGTNIGSVTVTVSINVPSEGSGYAGEGFTFGFSFTF